GACVKRRQQALAERGLLAAPGSAVPGRRRLQRRPRLRDPAERPRNAAEMHARERRQAHVAGRLGLLDRERERRRTADVVARLTLRATDAGELIGLGLQEAEASGGRRRGSEVADGIVEAVLDPGELAEDRVEANVQPWIVDGLQAVLDPLARGDGTLAVGGRDRRARREELVCGLVPRPVQAVVERARAIG